MYAAAGDVRALIKQFYQIAEAHAAFDNDTYMQVAYTLHAITLERLITLEYVRMGRKGLITPFLPRPTLREKCDAVVTALRGQGIHSNAVSSDRFAVLMPTAGIVKHAIFPRIPDLEQRLGWARVASLELYRHYFNEQLVPGFDTAA